MTQPTWILVGEDDPDDAILTKRALSEAELVHEVIQAFDGVEVLDCLKRKGRFSTRPRQPRRGST